MTRLVTFQQLLLIEFYSSNYFLCLILAVALMPLNWLLETKKWQTLMGKMNTSEAFFQVLNGVLYSWILPFTTGDVLARLERSTDKLKAGKAILINRIASFIVAASFGTIGILHYSSLITGVTPFVVVVLLLSTAVVLLRVIWKHNFSLVLFFSLARFMVISLQFYLLIRLFTDIGSFSWVMSGISWVFFFRSILPSLWGAIGIREVSAVLFFNCCINAEVIVTSSLLLWIINLVFATISFSIYRMWYLKATGGQTV